MIAVAIVYLSLVPANAGGVPQIYDKLNHFLAYVVLTGSVLFAWPSWRWAYVGGVCALLGGGLELTQAALPFGREGSWFDMLANLGGIAFAIGFHNSLAWLRRLQ